MKNIVISADGDRKVNIMSNNRTGESTRWKII